MASNDNLFRSRALQQFSSLHHEHPSYQWWVLANVMIGTFMAVLDVTIVNVGLPKIMAAFGVSIDTVGTGYSLTATGGSLTLATSSPFNITVSADYNLVFTQQPSGGAAWGAV